MDAEAIRTLQAPLKARYREDPASAVVTLRAEGRVGAEGVACKVDTGRALIEAGLHPASGGSGLQACSGDMLLEALVACAGVTLKAVATALGIASRCVTARWRPRATRTSAAPSGSTRTRRWASAPSACALRWRPTPTTIASPPC